MFLRRKILGCCVAGLVALQTGCSSKGFHRENLMSEAGVAKPTFDEKEIKDAFRKKPNLPKPFKIAVYFKAPKATGGSSNPWRWTESDRSFLEALASDLKASNTVSDVFPVPPSLVTDESLKGLRLAAARQQADALLIVGGAGEIDRFINGWGWSYILLVPAFFVPGSESRALFVTEASMIDVRNEFLYVSSEAEGHADETHAAAFGRSDRELLEAAKSESLAKLSSQLKSLIRGQNP